MNSRWKVNSRTASMRLRVALTRAGCSSQTAGHLGGFVVQVRARNLSFAEVRQIVLGVDPSAREV